MNSRDLFHSGWPTVNGSFRALAALLLTLTAMVLYAVLGTTAPSARAAEACPNAKYRTGPSLNLPDCRAYELVSVPLKANDLAVANGSLNPARVSDDGDTILYLTATGPTAETASIGIPTWERATRVGQRWGVGRAIVSPTGPYVDTVAGTPRWTIASADLRRTFSAASAIFSPDQVFDPGGNSQWNGGVFLADSDGATWVSKPTSANALPEQGTNGARWYRFYPIGGSTDLSTVYFNSSGTLTPEDDASGRVALESWSTYKWSDGQLSNAGTLPDGTLSPGGSVAADRAGQPIEAAPYTAETEMSLNNAVSSDGKSFLFVSPDPARVAADPSLPAPQLYMATEGQPTVLLSAPEGELSPVPGTEGIQAAYGRQNGSQSFIHGYAVATPDHSVVIFSSPDALTDDAEAVPGDITKSYRYESANGSLTYLPELDRPSDAQTNGVVLELSASGDSILYQTRAGLLRLWREGEETVTIADDLSASSAKITHSRFSTNENVLLLNSLMPLAGEPDHTPGTGTGSAGLRAQVYRYDIEADELECISCSPGGTPSGSSFSYWGATNGITGSTNLLNAYWATRGMTDDGSRAYFTTATALLPADHNSVSDVYQWHDGELSLISSGATGSRGERLYDTSADGSSVFIASSERLVSGDTDEYYDIYVARVNGGLESLGSSANDSGCVEDACQGGLPGAPSSPVAGSTGFNGDGNADGKAKPSVRVVKSRAVSGRTARLRVLVSGAGQITVSGRRLKKADRKVPEAGAYPLSIALNARARNALKKKGNLKAVARVRYRMEDGGSAGRRVKLTFDHRKAKQTDASPATRRGR